MEMNVRRVQRGAIRPAPNSSLVQNVVLNVDVERLNAPIQCTLCCSRHNIAIYSAWRIVTPVENDATDYQYWISDALEHRLSQCDSCIIKVFSSLEYARIVAVEGFIAVQCHNAHISGLPGRR